MSKHIHVTSHTNGEVGLILLDENGHAYGNSKRASYWVEGAKHKHLRVHNRDHKDVHPHQGDEFIDALVELLGRGTYTGGHICHNPACHASDGDS